MQMRKFSLAVFALSLAFLAFLAPARFDKPIQAKANAAIEPAPLTLKDAASVEEATFIEDAKATSMKFEITAHAGLLDKPQNGRLFIILGKTPQLEPRLLIGRTGMDAAPMLARDVNDFSTGKTGVIDHSNVAFPIDSLDKLPAGEYFIQALFDYNIDLKSVNAPNNLYSTVQRATLDPTKAGVIKLELTQKIADEQLPPDTENVKFVKIKSELLSKFHEFDV